MPPGRTAELTVIKSRVCQTCEDRVRLARARAQPSCTLHLSGLSVRFPGDSLPLHRQSRRGSKPGLPPWGPHVRFRRVQTLVREGSPLFKLLRASTPYRRDAAPVRPWRSVARGMPCKTGLSCRNPPAWLVASTRATILSTSFSASARSAAAVWNGAPMLLAVALRPRNVANRFFDMRGLGADDPARPKRGTPRIRINGGMYE